MNNDLATECASCHEPVANDDRFCEACGAPQMPGVIVDEVDHREIDTGIAAGVTDRGLVHRRNEDAMHVQLVGEGVVVIVSDGVSSSTAPDAASAAAAAAGAAKLTRTTDHPSGQGTGMMRAAIAAAQDAVVEVPWTRTRSRGAPSCTFVGAHWDGREITIGAVGDSRAYWVDDFSAELLTVDDSWAREQVDAGVLDETQVEHHPYAHAITRWLGEDAPGGPARVTTFIPPARGRLVVCTDGLWNYTQTPEHLGALVRAHAAGTPPIEIARMLTHVALAAGGRDNITVVVVDVTPAPTESNEELP
jgi:serine/threonine protein phosphatase PrpC